MSSARQSHTSEYHPVKELAVAGDDGLLGELGFISLPPTFPEHGPQLDIFAQLPDRTSERLRPTAGIAWKRHKNTAFAVLDQPSRAVTCSGDDRQSG